MAPAVQLKQVCLLDHKAGKQEEDECPLLHDVCSTISRQLISQAKEAQPQFCKVFVAHDAIEGSDHWVEHGKESAAAYTQQQDCWQAKEAHHSERVVTDLGVELGAV